MEWARRFDRPLRRTFYRRATELVARELLGQVLLRRFRGHWLAGRIVETEAYVANDAANHAFRGPTPRNQSMFRGPGTMYVYRIHQVHCANVVTRPGQAVLLRAVEPLVPDLKNPRGPGRLCREFHIDRSDDGRDVVNGSVRIVRGLVRSRQLVRGRRIGIRRAVDRRLRFADPSSSWVSFPRP